MGKAVLTALLAVLVGFSPAIGIVIGQESSWMQMAPVSSPSTRVGHAMAYDSGSDRLILFGGETAPLSNVLNDETWAYDLNSDTWENRNPISRPSARFAHGMAYDRDFDRVILFGGWTGTEQSTETWAYDYETNTWTNRTPMTSPAAGVFVDVVHDEESARTVLFGGGTQRFAGFSRATWAYDYASNSWTLMSPADSPSPRQSIGTMAYDSRADRVVLFGGQDAQRVFGDTWTYDQNSGVWARMNSGTTPSSRSAAAMAYDAKAERVVLFGGLTAGGESGETWAYHVDGDSWTEVGTTPRPTARFGSRMVYDVGSEVSVLFGGSSGGGQTWSHQLVSTPSPIPLEVVIIGVAVGAAVAGVVVILFRRRGG